MQNKNIFDMYHFESTEKIKNSANQIKLPDLRIKKASGNSWQTVNLISKDAFPNNKKIFYNKLNIILLFFCFLFVFVLLTNLYESYSIELFLIFLFYFLIGFFVISLILFLLGG